MIRACFLVFFSLNLLLLNLNNLSAENPDTRTLQVTGRAKIDVKADALLLSLGVETENEDARKALKINSETMNKVIKSLKETGLEKDEFKTSNFSISPVYHPFNANVSQAQRIKGYRVVNTISINTSKLDIVGKLLSAANKAGANTVNSVQFSLKDQRTNREKLIKKATDNALIDAKSLADSAGIELGKIKSISLIDSEDRFVSAPVMRSMDLSSAALDIPPLEGGDISLNGTVRVVFEIK